MINYLEKNEQQYYDLKSLLTRDFAGFFIGMFVKSKPIQFPRFIGEYRFESALQKTGSSKPYLLAVYKNSKGKKAVAKMQNARIKNYNYYSLLNEIRIYKILNIASARIRSRMPSSFRKINIPKFLHKYEDRNVLISLVEFVDGKSGEDLSTETKIPIYFQIVDFLQFVGKNLTMEEQKLISKRSPFNYLLLYPLLVAKAILTYPKASLHILKGVPVFISCLPAIFKNGNQILVHRDLHFMNVITKTNKIFLIDLQLCVYTESLYEMITTLTWRWKGWKDEGFGEMLFEEIIKRYSKRKNFKKIFQGFAINSATQGLTGVGFSKKVIKGLLDFLSFSIKLNFEKFTKI